MKPTKSKVFCRDCERSKMLFETEKKADNFIKFNKEEIEAESGYAPQRSYYCLFCGGWHLTSIKDKIGLSKKEQILKQKRLDKEKSKVTKLLSQEDSKIQNIIRNKRRSEILKGLESEIKEMDDAQKEKFFSKKLIILNNEIDQLSNVETETDIDLDKLKDLRLYFEIFNNVKKKNGFQRINKRFEETKEKEMEEWRLWAEKKGYT